MNHQSPSSSTSSSSSPHLEPQTLTLIPGLPYDLSALILAFIPFPHHQKLKPTCKSWKLFFSSSFYHSIRHTHIPISKTSHLLCIFPQDPSVSNPYLFDPETRAWCTLPLMPCNPHVYGLCNFASVSLDSRVYVLGGSLFDTRSFPLDRPSPSPFGFRYSFVTETWETLPPMLSPRGSFACATCVAQAKPNHGQIFVAGGGSRHTMFGAAGTRMSSVEDGGGGCPDVFMLDKNDIFRYDMTSNRWRKETTVPKRAIDESAVGFVALNGELHVMACHNGAGSVENRRLRRHKKLTSLYIQIYHPVKRIWRTLITQPPFQQPLDFKIAVMCTIRL